MNDSHRLNLRVLIVDGAFFCASIGIMIFLLSISESLNYGILELTGR